MILTNHFLPLNLISMKTWHMSQLGSRKTNWLQTWERGKTECMLFDTSQLTKNKTLVVVLQHRTLSETNSYKYQGVQLDQNLNIKVHTTQTDKKVCSRLQLLKCLQSKLTTKATVTIYQSIILLWWLTVPLLHTEANHIWRKPNHCILLLIKSLETTPTKVFKTIWLNNEKAFV